MKQSWRDSGVMELRNEIKCGRKCSSEDDNGNENQMKLNLNAVKCISTLAIRKGTGFMSNRLIVHWIKIG